MDAFVATVLAGLSVPLTGMLCAACYYGIAWLKARTRAEDMSNLDREATVAYGVGVQATDEKAPQALATGIATRGQSALTVATNYFRKRFPDRTAQIAKAAGAASTLDIHDAVQQTIAARLPNVISGTTLLPGPGGTASGFTVSVAPTLPGVFKAGALPPESGAAIAELLARQTAPTGDQIQ